jgi:2-dehydro-3-deoxyphosphogluconate aldolase / (4S)-4-hydroxy-2-oxoglutarate aldolase
MNVDASQEYFQSAFARSKVMVILRGVSPEDAVRLTRKAWDGGVHLVEIPLQNEESARALHAAILAGRDHEIGAGTITSTLLVEEAHEAGAKFTVAPGFVREVAERSLQLGMPHLPGVATPTEITAAMNCGFRWLKAFPAKELGPSWISAMIGPFPSAKFVATGGVDLSNAQNFIKAGVAGVSLGSSFEALAERDLSAIV